MYAIRDEIPIANAVRDGNHQRNQRGNRRQGNGARIRGRGYQHNINNPQLAFPNEDRDGGNRGGGYRGGGNRGGGNRGGGNGGGGNRGGGNRGGGNRGGGNRGGGNRGVGYRGAGNRRGGNPHNQNQMRNQMRHGNEVVLNTPRQNFDGGNIGGQQGGEQRSRWHGIGYRKLLDWSMIGDANDLVMKVLVSKFELEELLKKDDLKDDWLVFLIQIFKTLCEGRKSENRNALINLLCNSKFLKETIQRKLIMSIYGNQNAGNRNQEISDNLTVIFRTILNLFPSSTLDIPLDVFKTFVTSKHDIIYEENEMEELFEQRTKFLEKLDGKSDSHRTKNRNYDNVADDSKQPPQCYRELSTIPNREDIMEENPFLRKIKRDGAYRDGEHYLDVQFRLLREDLICPLRTGIMEILNDVDKEERKMNVKVYEGVNYMYGEPTNNGLVYKISFNITNHKGVPWKHSRRFLFGSLLCLTKDKFLTFIFATVANRDVKELENGILSIRLENSADLKYFDNANTLLMIESTSYFEAYKHVLDAMKEIQGEEIPMYRYIVECNAEIQPPAYLLDQPQKRYDLQGSLGITKRKSANVDVLNEKSWPSAVDTELNHSQLEAFKHALTKEFVLIQGPPGTGKTHVGLRIAHALLQNQSHQNKPMLIVCYTNHALDQFLTGLIEFGHANIIRVGGRCSQELMEYNLRNRSIRLMSRNKNVDKKNQDEDFKEIKRLRQAKHVPFSERRDMIEVLSNKMINSKTTEMALKEGEFISFEQLSKHMTENHRRWLEQYDVACKQLNLSVFDIFLNIINLPPDDLYNIEKTISVKRRDDRNVEHEEDIEDADEDNFIDVEGEAERLIDLYVLDENLYKTKKYKKQREKQNKSVDIKLVDRDGFEYILPQRKTRKRLFQKEFNKHEKLADEVVEDLYNPWDLDYESRWKLYKYWVSRYKDLDLKKMEEDNEAYEGLCRQVREFDELEDAIILRTAEVVAMTTTGAAKYRNILKNINPAIVIVEEAAEVLETHVLASLNHDVEQLILIGDHQQLQPNPSVHKLAVNYGLDISLFQRMINNNLECHTLQIQHRMRPEISRFMRHIYKRLDDHSSVWNYNCVRGVSKNVFFVDIKGKEEEIAQMKSKINKEEALYIRELCLYLLKNGYKPSEITILTGYAGQVIQFKKIMEKELFNGVRVTAVDNYQGEENKIILLSLVRSDKIGFWKKDNRVCVALSRAKEGLFVVGNFNLFTTNSELWKKIIADAQENDLYGEHLVLYCQNHPREQNIISKYTDFKKVPEGGCMQDCLYRLNCGHVCEKVCHPLDIEHIEYVCRKRCGKKVCLLNHICQRRCHYGDTCGECLYPVDKTIQECGHVQRVRCKDDMSLVKCQAKCQKVRNCGHPCQGTCFEDCEEQKCTFTSQKMLPCGHVGMVPCFEKEEDFKCLKACDAHLKCFHKCSGTCSSCKHGRLHRRCEQKCDRDLPCNHLCKDKCTKNCPPCSLPCANVCGHSMCKKKCGEICSPCMEPCLWRCQHKQCTNPCYDLCNRDPCNEPCQKFKRCGHRCIGLCGEPCPSLCRVCNKEDVEEIFFGTEDEPDSLFIELEDCKHILEVEGLDHWMSLKDDSAEVMLKKCPKCKQVIRKSVRYGNIIKIIMKDIENIKRMVSYGDDFIETQQTAYRKCQELNNIFLNKLEIGNNLEKYLILQEKDRLEDFLKTKPKESKGEPIPYGLAARLYLCIRDHAVRIINQADFLIKIEKHLVDSINGKHGKRLNKEFDRENILNEIENLRQYTIYWNINEEQFENAFVEFKRINVHINTMLVYQQLHKDTAFLKSEKFKKFERRTMKLFSLKLLDEQWLEKMKRFVDAIKTEFHCDGIPKEELNMVVQAMGFTKGHWFKCRNGHFYCIGECGGAMETAVCPECKEVIGGNNHALASGNRHASEVDNSRFAAYSEQANDPRNWDPRQLAELQRW